MEKSINIIPGTRVVTKFKKDGSTVTISLPENKNYKFKDGDFVRSVCRFLSHEWYYIYKGVDENGAIKFYALFDEKFVCKEKKISFGIGYYMDHVDSRIMTMVEKTKAIESLKIAGSQWDAENKRMVNIKPEFKPEL